MEKKFEALEKIFSDRETTEKLFAFNDPEKSQVFLREHGADLTIDEIKRLCAEVGAIVKPESRELSESELENVAGGYFGEEFINAHITLFEHIKSWFS